MNKNKTALHLKTSDFGSESSDKAQKFKIFQMLNGVLSLLDVIKDGGMLNELYKHKRLFS